MRLGRMTAVVVLAAGLMSAGVVPAAAQEGMPPSETTPVQKAGRRAAPKPAAKPYDPSGQQKILSGFSGRWKSKLTELPDRAVAAAPVPAAGSAADGAPAAAPASAGTTKSLEGTAEGKLILGGRYAQIAHQSVRDGQPVEGLMTVGYDEIVGRYRAVWIDSASNAMISYVGSYDTSKKALTFSSHYSDPTTRRLTIARIVITFVDSNTWTYDEYVANAVGEKELHTKLITYKHD